MAAVAPKKTGKPPRTGPPSAFSLLRYMHKMKPADLSPTHDDLSSQDSSLENEESPQQEGRKKYCTKCDSCDPHTSHQHSQSQSESNSPRGEEQRNDNQNANNCNSNNNMPANNNKKSERKNSKNPPGPDKAKTPTNNNKEPRRPSEGGRTDTPNEVDLMEVIKISEVSHKRSIAEVLSQVVKLERSSSASELNRSTPEAPDIVASTTNAREKGNDNKGGKVLARNEGRRADVATLVLLCQHYAQLVQALKEENYLLSCTQSPHLPATPKSGLRSGRGRSGKSSVFTWDNDNYEYNNKLAGLAENKTEAQRLANEYKTEAPRLASDPLQIHSYISNSPAIVKLNRSASSSRDYYSKSPRQSPARIQDDIAALNVKERRHWNLKPLRNVGKSHKRDSKHHRKSSFSFFRDSKEPENLEEDNNGNESPRHVPSLIQNPTVGVLSTKISDMESKIEELMKLEPVSDILRDNSEDRSPARRSVGSGDTLRRTNSKRGHFYRHSVRDSARDKRSHESRDSDDASDDPQRRGGVGGGGTCVRAGGCQYQILAQAAHVEVDKLRQLVNLLNTRLTEMSGRMLAAEGRLREEQHRTAIMEKCIERKNLDVNGDVGSCRLSCRSQRSSSSEGGIGRRHGPSLLAWGDVASDTLLRNKVEMAREEIELLRQHIDLLLRMRQEDLKVYESTVDKFRHTLASGSQW